MAQVTIQLIEGLERGRVYANLSTPVTLGREDDNGIQLNDERVSRFHAKIQEDGGRPILTDLDSTNGTRVNGHPVQMRVLQLGDQISIGRCLLLFGSREEISTRLAERDLDDNGSAGTSDHTIASRSESSDDDDDDDPATSQVGLSPNYDVPSKEPDSLKLFPDGAPNPPTGLRPLQRAEVSDFLAYVHEEIRTVLQAAYEDPNRIQDGSQTMCINWSHWQHLLRLEMELSVYLRKLAEPEE